ncbi:MAG: L,D-transpeptidase family protein, partial [Acidimicrobiales bacterium]
QQLLAELDYLPVTFARTGPSGPSGVASTYPAPVTTTGSATDPTSALAVEPTVADAVPLEPEPGSFQWEFSNTPSQLAALWVPGAWNVVTQGALMAFEADHGLQVDGVAGPTVWAALLQAVAARAVTTLPYTYLIATETLPETLYVWRAGQVVFQTPVNTGVYKAATPLGTWPVFLRFTSTTMKGTNPDGTKYADKGVPWVSYFYESDAVHGFLRAAYGYPQSDGCVELPYSSAETVFPLDTYGTLVTITTGELWQQLGTTAPPPLYIPPSPTTTTTTLP